MTTSTISDVSHAMRAPRSVGCTTFPRFGELPKEIRLLILSSGKPHYLVLESFTSEVSFSELVNLGEIAFAQTRHLHVTVLSAAYNAEHFARKTKTKWEKIKIVLDQKRRTQDTTPEDHDIGGWSSDDDLDLDQEVLQGPIRLQAFRTKCPAPVALFVCRESYDVASKVYTRCFASLGGHPTVWFNYQMDTLYLNNDSFTDDYTNKARGWPVSPFPITDGLELFSSEELRKVENLCVFLENMGYVRNYYGEWVCSVLGTFGGVKKFSAITKHPTHSVWEKGLTVSEKWDLAIMKPLDIRAACSSSGDNFDETQCLGKISLSLYNGITTLDSDRDSHIKLGRKSFSMPIVEFGMVVSATIKSTLETRKHDWNVRTGRATKWPGQTILRDYELCSPWDDRRPHYHLQKHFAAFMDEALVLN